MENLFEKASRLKLRFASAKGKVTVEDLWDLPLTTRTAHGLSLDNLAKAANREIKTTEEESFVTVNKTKDESIAELMLEVLKYIIKVKLAEAQNKQDAKLLRLKKEKILDIIASKEDESLMNTDIADLKKMLADL